MQDCVFKIFNDCAQLGGFIWRLKRLSCYSDGWLHAAKWSFCSKIYFLTSLPAGRLFYWQRKGNSRLRGVVIGGFVTRGAVHFRAAFILLDLWVLNDCSWFTGTVQTVAIDANCVIVQNCDDTIKIANCVIVQNCDDTIKMASHPSVYPLWRVGPSRRE